MPVIYGIHPNEPFRGVRKRGVTDALVSGDQTDQARGRGGATVDKKRPRRGRGWQRGQL